jgi:hypothetical protein
VRAARAVPVGLVLACAASWIPALQAAAQSAEPPALTPVAVRVRVVEAEEQQGQVDGGMEDLQRQLHPMKFGSMKLVQDERLQLLFGQRGLVRLPTGEVVQVLPISVVEHRLHMHVEGPRINGRFQMRPHQPVVVVGGRGAGRRHLIISIVPDF